MATNIASPNILITCFLLLFCTFSTSTQLPLDPFDIDQFDFESALGKDNIFLAGQNLPEPDSHPAEETTHHHFNIDKPTTKTTTETLEESKPLPLTVFRFGPIDRSRFPRRPLPLSSDQRVRHRCHHTHRHYRPWNNRHLPHRDSDSSLITKINDVDKEFDVAAPRDGDDDWMRFEDNIDEPISLSRKRSKAMEKSELLKRIHTRYNQLRREKAEKKIKDNGSTYVKRIRKFLNGV
ncbi:unnamed protein product [Vicia faba]|uniref:Uncharacterized protein n=1 Tax=Vicia faba TaxID=3906 RepID=A0AAV0YXP9_VICFA|nr:unnamed protein product [Vicia faba]